MMDSSPFNKILKPAIEMESMSLVKEELRAATCTLTNYRLNYAAKWAGELLVSIAEPSPPKPQFPQVDASYDSLQLARVLFDLKEYFKAASVLTEFNKPEYAEAYFLYNYALYMYGEFRKEEESIEEGG